MAVSLCDRLQEAALRCCQVLAASLISSPLNKSTSFFFLFSFFSASEDAFFFALVQFQNPVRFISFWRRWCIFCNIVVSFPSCLVVSTFSWFFKVKVLLFSWKYQACPGLWKKSLLRQFVSVLSDVFDLVGRGTERRR